MLDHLYMQKETLFFVVRVFCGGGACIRYLHARSPWVIHAIHSRTHSLIATYSLSLNNKPMTDDKDMMRA